MSTVSDYFGCLVFDDRVMKANLSADVYASLRRTIDEGAKLDASVANAVAAAMKDWAVAHGATHYTHWFQPLTGITAEKHDSFISPAPDGGVIMDFSGKELIKGEPDASSFPSGGLRATFEARGYTAWDPTSYAFIKGKTLCIPTAFCSYGGEALDKKTPLLRSMEALNRQAMRILKLFGNTDVKCVRTNVGPEQEYFLVDKEMYEQRKDLIFTGRTLFGAKSPKGQEMDDHYFGVIKPRVAAYMEDLNEELWKLGILAKTEHNEVAPAQHELAPIYTTTNIATDHNQLTMEIMQKVAAKHGLVCLLHEKPFAGVNGSGKHNNWSMATDTGVNLLSPGETPYENAQFLLFLCAVIKAVDDYQDLLRLSVATAGNDHRLGANEAPPAIISVYLGDQLKAIFDAIEEGKTYKAGKASKIEIGVDVIPDFEKDNSDRNRTSPFAFTGNKFEFRALGSSLNIGCPNVMINVAVADAIERMVNILSDVKAEDFEAAVRKLIRDTYKEHKAIVFNGNNYSEEWINVESKKRGLPEIKSTPDALPYYTKPENVELFKHFGIFSERECEARKNILLEQYAKVINIEAHTMYKMTAKQILPACAEFMNVLSESVKSKKDLGMSYDYEGSVLYKISRLVDKAYAQNNELEELRRTASNISGIEEQTKYLHDTVLAHMDSLRDTVDQLELLVSSDYWPLPSYGDMLFYQD